MFDASIVSHSRAWVEVRLDRLLTNAAAVRRTLGPDARLVPMVKADAYGLGLGPVVQALREGLHRDALWALGVATVAEGEALRALGWTGRVLVCSPALPGEYRRAAEASLTLCLSEVAAVRRWAEAAVGRALAFHVEVDTGMGRAGLRWTEAASWGAEVVRAAGDRLRWEGVFTHFHSADEPDLEPTDAQWRRFQEARAALPPEAGDPVVHVANSAASMRCAGYALRLARPGIFLYGGAVGAAEQPEAVVSVRARLALVREVPAGATLGYGASYTARAPERWGTVAIGYGDGLPRALWPGGGEALIRGRRVPLIGRVSMDATTLDLSAVPDAAVGDVVTLIGCDADAAITLDEVAARAGTISYEILTGLTPRLPRLYLRG